MATQTTDASQLTREIRDLELEEQEIERKILAGEISREEGQRARTELASRISELTKEQSGLVQEIPQPAEKNPRRHERHQQSASHAPHAPHPEKTPSLNEDPAQEKTVLAYSKGGFLSGKLFSRIKERFFAKKEIQDDQKATETKRIQASKKPRYFVRWINRLGEKYIPLKTRERIRKIFPKKPAQATTQAVQKHKKTVVEYLKTWNNNALTKAIGYDRFAVARKVRDMKIWKTRGWKYGKYALLTPAGGAAVDAYKWRQNRNNNESNKNQQSSPSVRQLRRIIGGEDSSSLLSPRGIGGRAWNKFASPQISNINRKLGQKIGGRVGQSVAKGAAKQIAKKAVQQAVTEGATALLANPVSLTIIGVILVILLFIGIVIFITLNASIPETETLDVGAAPPPPVVEAPPGTPAIPGFDLKKDVDALQTTYPNKITYTISYTFTPSDKVKLEDIVIYDVLPNTVTLQSASGVKEINETTHTISWKLSDPGNTSPFSVIVVPKEDGVDIVNKAYADASPANAQGPNPATADNCNGTYNLTNPIGNFGDPDCFFAKNKPQAMSELYSLLQEQDPANAYNWYYKVAACETGGTYNPNSYRPHHIEGDDPKNDTPDPNGAWGLFQMSMNNYNKDYDLGAVPWRDQVTNAVGYGKRVKASGLQLGAYWACWQGLTSL